jgi:hypothetical protein
MAMTEIDPRRVRLADIAAELAEVDEIERKSRAEMPEFRVENVGDGRVAAKVQEIQSKMWECDSKRAVLKAERKSIALALNESVTREARQREAQVFATVLEALSPFVREMEQILAEVSECRAAPISRSGARSSRPPTSRVSPRTAGAWSIPMRKT